MKKILVPCDFSGPSNEAFKMAASIAASSKGEIFVLNIVEMPVLTSSLVVPVPAYEKAFLKGLKEKANKNFLNLKDRWAQKTKVSFFVEQGSVAGAVNKFIARKKVDVVVMGTHGSSGLRDFTVGSNTEKIVRSSKVPVISVRQAPRSNVITDLVFPTDLAPDQRKLAEGIQLLQSFFKAKLHILYVNNPANFQRDIFVEKRLAEFAKQYKFKNYSVHIYNDIDVENGVINFSARFKNKMIVMSTHGRKGLGRLLSGSVAEDVVNHLNCPIWTLAQ